MNRLLTRIFISLMTLGLIVSSPVHAKQLKYLDQPFPDIKQNWRADDYELALDSLVTIQKSQPDLLPKRRGEFTGPVYDRFISEDNFRFQLDIKEPVEMRREEAVRVSIALKEMMRTYFDFKAKKQVYGSEALGIMSYSLRQQAIFFTLSVEYWLSLPQEETKQPQRLGELEEHKRGAASLLSSAFKYLALTGYFDREDLEVYGWELAHITPELFVHLPLAKQQSIALQVENLKDDHESHQVVEAMTKLHPNLLELISQHQKVLEAQKNTDSASVN
ncbi:hypothetical protein [Litoribacillus peritrichatus]|uniref:Uncharacterized protein n=1 Tax=Litoribacillus peritrichatus TaxID=718191 RepID=A0ABP7N7P4_9GAMM